MAIKKAKTLTEAAREVLSKNSLVEGATLPTIGPITGGISNPNPVTGEPTSTANAKTLRPKSKSADERHGQTGGGSGSGDFPGAEDLGGSTPTSNIGDNLGAKAARGKKRDTSIKGSGVHQEPGKHLEEDEEFDLPEELKDFIEEAIEAGLSEEEIEEAIEENFEFVSEEDETLEEEDSDLPEELKDFIEEGIEAGLTEEEIEKAIEEKFKVDKYTNDSSKRGKNAPYGGGDYVSMKKRFKVDKYTNDSSKRGKNAPYGGGDYVSMKENLENYELDFSEDVNALLEGENLSEEFKTKATTIFEAAVKNKLEEEINLLEEAYAETLEERVEAIVEQLTNDVDSYLNYVIEQWIEENEIAIESSLRSELTEDFISGLRTLFAEHYIDIPEEQVNVVEELSSTVEELEAKLNEEIERNVQLNTALTESQKLDVIYSASDGLTTTQAEKLRSLAENVEFTDEEDFLEKIETLKENYFPTNIKTEGLDTVEPKGLNEETGEELNGRMKQYVKVLGAKLPN